MKDKFILVLVVVLLFVVGVLSIQHYQNHKNKQQHDQAVIAKAASEAQAKERASAQADRAKLVAQYNQLRVECEKGKASYDQLPKSLQKPVQAPVCGAVLL